MVMVAVAAGFGVMLVVYGIGARDRAIAEAETGGPSARVPYRPLADVREQLRRRFEPTGAPVWIGQQSPNALAADLASADLQLRPYEFRILQVGSALVFAIIGYTRFTLNLAVPILAVIGSLMPALFLANRQADR